MDLREPSTTDPIQNTWHKPMLESPVAPQHSINQSCKTESGQSVDSDDPPRCTYQCLVCGKWFLDSFFLRRHELVHTKEKPHQCVKCSKFFTQKTSLARHMLIHLRVKKFQCSLCPMKFVQKVNLETHVKQRHPTLDGSVSEHGSFCRKCPSVFKTAGRLRAHRARIHGEMVMFDQCFKTEMTTSNNKQSSIDAPSNAHDDDDTRTSDVESFTSNTAQQTEHDGEIVHKIIKSRRTEHMNGRTDKRQCVCEVCKAAFKKPQYLSQHMISHTGIRPHRCNICDKTFSAKQSYNTHMKLHSNSVRLFNCDKCEETFNRFAALKRHQSMIHNALQHLFRCPYCENRFRWLHNARTHIKTFHSKGESSQAALLEPVKERVKINQEQTP